MSITPMTRVELFLAALAGEDYTAPDPMTRIEVYLDCIEKGTAATLVPMTRIELYLAKISGADVDIPPYPMTRIEMFLAALCDEDITPPAAMTRIELYLANWIENAGTDVTNTAPYLFRSLPYNAKKKTLNKIVGGTVVWNQLANNGSASVTSGHKYISCSSGTWSIGTSNGTAISADMVFDITLMFGSTIADYIYGLGSASCVAWFRNLFPSASYPYDAGSLLSVKTSASKMVGVNLLDSTNIFQGNFESYGQEYIYNVVTGFIRVLPNTRYYERKRFQTSGCYVRLYKADKTTYTSINKYGSSDFDFTTEADTAYVRLMWYTNTGITPADVINADCCLNVYDASINGTYVPYVKSEYALSNTELRGIPKLDASNNLYYDGDEYTPDGTVKRKYGIVDLGTISWTKSTIGGNTVFTAALSDALAPSLNTQLFNGVAVIYRITSRAMLNSAVTDNLIALNTISTLICAPLTTYADANAFKTAMSGVYLIYELATPTTETTTGYTAKQTCYPNGTEEFVDGRTVEVPVGHETVYKAKENT